MTGTAAAEDATQGASTSVLATILADLAAVDLESASPPEALEKGSYYKLLGPASEDVRRAYVLRSRAITALSKEREKGISKALGAMGSLYSGEDESDEAIKEKLAGITKDANQAVAEVKLAGECICLLTHVFKLEAARQFPEVNGRAILLDEDWNIGYDDIPSGIDFLGGVIEISVEPVRRGRGFLNSIFR